MATSVRVPNFISFLAKQYTFFDTSYVSTRPACGCVRQVAVPSLATPTNEAKRALNRAPPNCNNYEFCQFRCPPDECLEQRIKRELIKVNCEPFLVWISDRWRQCLSRCRSEAHTQTTTPPAFSLQPSHGVRLCALFAPACRFECECVHVLAPETRLHRNQSPNSEANAARLGVCVRARFCHTFCMASTAVVRPDS